ncbi:APO protein 4- mitochondrial [Striga hermonthica]|uniref:APO protein 4- mitochondrial n=1 Tax=Striga hermonthica TaxID=68872 RepID=A0A9N7MQB9_STRHE|nr:APO protein 4- mitochondrial [Striga hermonthica]
MNPFVKMNLKLNMFGNGSLAQQVIFRGIRFYSTKPLDMKKLKPMILKRIEERSKDYPIRAMIPVANEVLRARAALYDGVSTLVQHIPVWACKYCSEVFIGESGHLIHTCQGFRHHAKNKAHNWVKATVKDIIVPVQTFHLQRMFQNVIEHNERFDYDRVPAVIELCLQAGANINNEDITKPYNLENNATNSENLSQADLRSVGTRTLHAWEALRSGVHKLLMVYPARFCKHCNEVHVGPSGHKARTCGVFKYDNFRGGHFWEKAKVDNLVPQKVVWIKRRQDPPVLVDKGREYYGRAPVVVDLCSKAGTLVPSRYFCMMKLDGLTAPS